MRKKILMKNGFSMLEIVIVISLLALLVLIGTLSYKGITNSSKDLSTKYEMKSIEAGLSLALVREKKTYRSETPVAYSGDLVNSNGVTVNPSELNLYNIKTEFVANNYVKNLKNDINDYLADAQGNVYYKGMLNE